MAHQLALFYIPGGKMSELRRRQREKRVLRKLKIKRHAPGTVSALHRRTLCGYKGIPDKYIVIDQAQVNCKSCMQKLLHGPSMRDIIKEKAYTKVLKTVAW